MVEIKVKDKQIESIEKRGEVMTAEEQRMKEERISISGQKIVKSGWSGKYDKKSNFPKKERLHEKDDEMEFDDQEVDMIEGQYDKQNREIERRERF